VPPRLDLAVTADPLIYENGTDITITYKITNNGDIQLQNVSLLDGDDNPVCPDQNPLAALDPGVTEFCEAQLNSEGLLGINVHAVSETPVTSSPSVQFFSGEEQDTPQTGLLVEKYAGYPLKYSETDTTVEIPFLLTNTGNVAIKGPFNFEEDLEDTDPNPVFECIVLNETADDLAVLPPDQSKICILEVQAPEYLASAKLEKTFQVIFNNGANTSPDPVSIEAHNNSYQAISMSLTKKLEITSEKTLGEFSEAANDFTISSSDEAFNFVFNLHASDGSSNVRIGPADSYPIQIDSDIADGLALAPMELSLVTLGFDMLGSLLEQNLDADRWEYKRIPFAGSDLAVGIDFSEVTNALGKPLIDFFEQFASETSTLSDLCAFEFDDTTDDTGDLIKISDKFVITALDSDENEATCSNTNDPPLDQIAEFSLQLQAEYDIETKIPFDIGLPGLPLESTDNAPVEVGG